MIENKTWEDLCVLAVAGASLEIDAENLAADRVREIALRLHPGAILRICKSDLYSTESCRDIALL